jgi:hypothetical protein
MLTTVDLPDTLFHESQALAASRGATVEQFIVESIARCVHESEPVPRETQATITLPLIRSTHPGTLDLSEFDFDDLLA